MNINIFEVCVENIRRVTLPHVRGLTFSCPDLLLEGLNATRFCLVLMVNLE